MEQKSLKIIIPEGYEIDAEKSTFENIVFKPIKKVLNYDDVSKELFQHKKTYFIASDGTIREYLPEQSYGYSNSSTSQKQAEKLLAINKLMNVARYLNGDWMPNLMSKDISKRMRFFIYIGPGGETHEIHKYDDYCSHGHVYFKSYKLAKQAIEILGHEIVKLALDANY